MRECTVSLDANGAMQEDGWEDVPAIAWHIEAAAAEAVRQAERTQSQLVRLTLAVQ